MALTEDKFLKKQQLLVERTARALQVSEAAAAELLQVPRLQSVRVNTLKLSLGEASVELESLGATLSKVPWMAEGYFVEHGLAAVRDSPLAEEGSLYIQNAASWLPVLALNPQPGETILDMCAAPGGKTSHIAQHGHNNVALKANDNSRPRLMKLQRNLERLGVEDCTFTLHDATRLAQAYPGMLFDKILLDAPCSGEGMMHLHTKKDFESWSVAHIKRLQQLQKKLIVQAWLLLKTGGILIYSTCTMAPEENEAVVDYLLRRYDDATVESLETLALHLPNRATPVESWNGKPFAAALQKTLRLAPSDHIEAFYVAKLTKLFEP